MSLYQQFIHLTSFWIQWFPFLYRCIVAPIHPKLRNESVNSTHQSGSRQRRSTEYIYTAAGGVTSATRMMCRLLTSANSNTVFGCLDTLESEWTRDEKGNRIENRREWKRSRDRRRIRIGEVRKQQKWRKVADEKKGKWERKHEVKKEKELFMGGFVAY